jgi:hypothetical protein bacD2_23304
MKKIMFNDKYGLTQAVLDGRKTQTRRVIKCPREFKGEWVAGFNIHIRQSDKKVVGWPCMYDADEREFDGGEILPRYKVGEIVAVAQSYKNAGFRPDKVLYRSIPEIDGYVKETACCQKGWNNKMFVAPNLMPHQIRITNVRIQRLQDISDEDCLAEGVVKIVHSIPTKAPQYITGYYPSMSLKEAAGKFGWGRAYSTPQYAYADLIDKVSDEGTWESNPWVWVYEFELMK